MSHPKRLFAFRWENLLNTDLIDEVSSFQSVKCARRLPQIIRALICLFYYSAASHGKIPKIHFTEYPIGPLASDFISPGWE
jgi:hypothetical protein